MEAGRTPFNASALAIFLGSRVITGSVFGRGIVTAVSWLGKNIKAFAPSEIDKAYDFLQMSDASRKAVTNAVGIMQKELRLFGAATDSK